MKSFFGRLYHILKNLILNGGEVLFIKHNEKVWNDYRFERGNGQILLEANTMASSIISYSYLANLLSRIHKSSITAYFLKEEKPLSCLTDLRTKKIYRSFNVFSFIYINLNSVQKDELKRMYLLVYPLLKTKKDVENLSVEGIWLGDLLYDSYLMDYRLPTIDIDNVTFQTSLKECIAYYIFWRDYLKINSVKAIILSHCVYYRHAVLLRLAVKEGIPVYQCNATHLYLLNQERLWAYDDFYDYPEMFRKLSPEAQQKGMLTAREKLERRFSGEIGVDMHYSTKSAYTKSKVPRIIKESPRIKLLIATHCFFDSPHPYGVNLFPDFYEWLTFLGTISDKTDYDWYIKTHPDFLPGNIPIIEKFIEKYPKFNIVPSDTSHLQLIEEGVRFGLTVYGTIGFEYAALGIPVINASLCNPHIRYNFNIHPKSIDEYEKILMDLDSQKLKIDINEVYEYYVMAFINNTNNWLFLDYEAFIKSIGGYTNQFGSTSYEVFIKELTMQRHEQIKGSLIKFVDSKEYRFREKEVFV